MTDDRSGKVSRFKADVVEAAISYASSWDQHHVETRREKNIFRYRIIVELRTQQPSYHRLIRLGKLFWGENQCAGREVLNEDHSRLELDCRDSCH